LAEIKFFAGRILQGLPEKEVLLCKAKSCIAFCFCLVGLFAVAVAGTLSVYLHFAVAGVVPLVLTICTVCIV